MKRWRAWLKAHVSQTPYPTPECGSVPHFDPTPRVILFDVYGTLLAARHGDLEDQVRRRLAQESFVKTALFFGYSEEVGNTWAENFYQAIAKEHEHGRSLGISRPEVLVEHIWKTLLENVADPPDPPPHPMDVAMYRELVANPVSPFEGAVETLRTLHGQGFLLGLASNAQFYTRPILEYALGTPLHAVFDERWTFFSYELGFAKPDPHFFRLIATRARRFGLDPEVVLMVGNDPVNDMEAAQIHGLQTVLFMPGVTAHLQDFPWNGPRTMRFDALVQALGKE
ncbi:HAD family hydrolase [Desulfosoma caldarium]|uniref:Putative hydrolase of the HAD superfamily n=1 Tax=Desulfosoma caldarium TaxID=610254 RepID=A0A3N1V276_9BACT|nr:HAD family hydrolase [Desulfosoma caldarium]ROQ93606.1 putative hydrolase of the HAD superfamily [Desulfosoma caldarium]